MDMEKYTIKIEIENLSFGEYIGIMGTLKHMAENSKYDAKITTSEGDIGGGDDILVLLERKHPTVYEIHRRKIQQSKNLILTTEDKGFAERLVVGYNQINKLNK